MSPFYKHVAPLGLQAVKDGAVGNSAYRVWGMAQNSAYRGRGMAAVGNRGMGDGAVGNSGYQISQDR